MDLTVAGDSNYTSTGTPDTYTVLSNGPSGNDGVAENVNGPAKAITLLQALLGNALTLKGSTADLVTRLSRIVGADGAFAKGVAFPGTPIDGQPFYRTDLNVLYIYDAGSTSWTVGVDSGEFLKIDGSRAMTGDLEVRKNAPALRLLGLEGSAADLQIKENAGVLIYSRNTGSESVPVWTEFFRITPTTGAILSLLYQLTGSGSFKSIFSHANTADRTITLGDNDYRLESGVQYRGPSSVGSGSTRSHEGSVVISAPTNLSGVHYYDDFTINVGQTVTVPAGGLSLVIIAKGTITINGTIAANGAGLAGAAPGATADDSTDQPGGSGGTSNGGTAGTVGGRATVHGVVVASAGTQVTGSLLRLGHDPTTALGGAPGGAGGKQAGAGGATGGTAGASVVLIAPVIVLAATAVINTSGVVGGNGTTAGSGGAGGGAAGNFYAKARSYTDGGATFTQTGGGGGSHNATGADGTAGQNGVKQIEVYGT